MNYFKKSFLLFLCFVVFLGFYISFNVNVKNDYSNMVASGVSSITLNKKVLRVQVGGSEKLNYSFSPNGASASVVWVSANKNVVSVSDGVVKGVSEGKTSVIVALKDNYSIRDVCEVTVVKASSSSTPTPSPTPAPSPQPQPQPTPSPAPTPAPAPKANNITKVVLNVSKKTLNYGDSYSLKTKTSPSGASGLVFTSSDQTLVSVTNTGVIKAVKNFNGSATIKVAAANNPNVYDTVKVVVKPKMKVIGTYKSAGTLVNISGDGMKAVHISQGFCVVHKGSNIFLVTGMRNSNSSKGSISIYKRTGGDSFKLVNKFYRNDGLLHHNNGMTYNPNNNLVYVATSQTHVRAFDFNNGLKSKKKSPSFSTVYFKKPGGEVVATGGIAYNTSNGTFFTGSGSKLRVHYGDGSGVVEIKKAKYVNSQDISYVNNRVLVLRYNPKVTDAKSTVEKPHNAVDVYDAATLEYLGTNIIKLGNSAELESVDYYDSGYFAAHYYVLRGGKGKVVKIKLNLG
ncbi:MAG: Ig-like domain-containing protein [Bacilli bacterium]|nr:Ig-like domain-containing protein [Bacilli bacterium]